MHQLEFFVPDGYPRSEISLDDSIMEMCARLRGVDKNGARIPNTDLAVELTLLPEGAGLEITKSNVVVFLNFFCFEVRNSAPLFAMVKDFYKKHNLGVAKRPKLPGWIHCVPVAAYGLLDEDEIIFCKQVTVSFYWIWYAQLLKKANPMN